MCRHVEIPGGGFAIVCGERKPRRCACGATSSKLCDYPLGDGAAGSKTCDAPICATCATHVEPDTDYCRVHAQLVRGAAERSAEAQAVKPALVAPKPLALVPVFGDPRWIKIKRGRR